MADPPPHLRPIGNFDGYCALALSLCAVLFASNKYARFDFEREVSYIAFLAVITGTSIGGIRFGSNEAKFAGSLALFWTIMLIAGEVGYAFRWF